MLKELHISNYRLFDDLTIPELGQVNLIAGKNNTGKTALLEALRIWAAEGDTTVINYVIAQRGQFNPGWGESYESLFTNHRIVSQQTEEPLSLIIKDLTIQRHKPSLSRSYCELFLKHKRVDPNLNPNAPANNPNDRSVFVPFSEKSHFPLQDFWTKIVLTPLEDDVLDILKIVEPRLRRIDVNEENSKVLLEGDSKPIPLKSLGEGMSRMLWLAVALVSAKESKLLLIDEFEAGLHHSVQETLWEKVFQYAKEWDIQVFVTTHSMDTVQSFHEVADQPENLGLGKYFRLQRNQNNQIEAVSYSEEELATALEFELETR